jgi:GT2 family glycosyltransferase
VVVDNGSTDGTVEWLDAFRGTASARGVPVSVIHNRDNVGCSTARNQGIAAARGNLLAFVDNDVALRSRDWLARLRAVLGAEPRCAMVGCKLVYPFPPHDIQCAGVGVSRTGRVLFRGRGEPREAPDFNAPREVQCLISACCVGRADAIREAGGFDEAFNPVQFEDFDLCYRLREQGATLRYEPGVEMYHFESVTTQGTPSLVNAEVVIRHGLLFKRRWRHVFAAEDGPADAETRWREVPSRAFGTIGDLPVL